MKNSGIKHKLVPPHNHRDNLTKRTIRTFENHFIAGLTSVDPDFPIREWDRLVNQAEITLNLLRASRANPKLSAYAYLFGQFDWNATPLVPPVTKILVHAKLLQRPTWAPHGEEG